MSLCDTADYRQPFQNCTGFENAIHCVAISILVFESSQAIVPSLDTIPQRLQVSLSVG